MACLLKIEVERGIYQQTIGHPAGVRSAATGIRRIIASPTLRRARGWA
jgi:hypothetical protein